MKIKQLETGEWVLIHTDGKVLSHNYTTRAKAIAALAKRQAKKRA
jgi:hydrogenase maturation factor